MMRGTTLPGIIELSGIEPHRDNDIDLDGYCYTTEDEGLWYYDVFSKPGAGPTVYRKLIGEAESRIDVWDPYLHKSDADLFSAVPSNIDLRILTCFGANEASLRNLESMEGNLEYRGFIESIKLIQSEQKFGLKIAIINSRKCSIFGKGKIPHDRLLFVDTKPYIVGSSLEYHSAESSDEWMETVKNTLIYRVEGTKNQELLYRLFLNFWNEGHEYYQKYVDVLVNETGG